MESTSKKCVSFAKNSPRRDGLLRASPNSGIPHLPPMDVCSDRSTTPTIAARAATNPTISFDPSRVDLSPYGFTCKRWAPVVMRRPDRHNEIELNFLTEGWLTYLIGGRLVRVEANQLTAFWAAVPHQIIDHGPQREYFVVTIPLRWLLSLRLADSFVQALMHGQVVTASAGTSSLIVHHHLREWELDFESASVRHDAAYLELEAVLSRLSLDCQSSPTLASAAAKRPSTIHEGALAKAEQIAQLVANHYAEPINALELTRRVDAQPKRAMKVFRLVFGVSAASFLTEYRIAQAQRLLATTSMRIVDISESSGFGSLGRFNRAFLELCGCSPREYRKRHSLVNASGSDKSAKAKRTR